MSRGTRGAQHSAYSRCPTQCLQCPKARVSDSKARAYQPLLAYRAREFRNAFLKLRNALITRGFLTVDTSLTKIAQGKSLYKGVPDKHQVHSTKKQATKDLAMERLVN
jgi:hypothetical protein